MEKKKSPRNKTIDFGEEEGRIYLQRAVAAEELTEERVNVTVLGDMFEAVKHIARESVDLIVADPPYNLDKNFHGNPLRRHGQRGIRRVYGKVAERRSAASEKKRQRLRLLRLAFVHGDRRRARKETESHKPHHLAARKGARRGKKLEKRAGGYLVRRERQPLYL